MPDIYDLHDRAFRSVSAYVVLLKGERVATVAFKHPRDGAGRLSAYVHWRGTPMVRGWAGGGGYDKRTAACVNAVRQIQPDPAVGAFRAALQADTGPTWDDQLRRAGFTVLQAV